MSPEKAGLNQQQTLFLFGVIPYFIFYFVVKKQHSLSAKEGAGWPPNLNVC